MAVLYTVDMSSFEQLGAFYLGHLEGAEEPTPLLYDAKDLTTHAVVVGMTGSGKTGLGITLIEEAIIDGVPVLAIDPKGDLGNLLLTFPSLRAQDFRPWIDESDATRHGRSADEHAQWTADLWRRGLKETGQRPARIRAFAEAAERTIYTPGSRDGRPISVLRSLAPPPAEVMSDDQALRDRIGTAVSGLLGLVGVTGRPHPQPGARPAGDTAHAWLVRRTGAGPPDVDSTGSEAARRTDRRARPWSRSIPPRNDSTSSCG